MSVDPKEPASESESRHATRDERLVYVMPAEAVRLEGDERVDLFRAWRVLWHSKWLIVGVAALVVAAGVAYALLATKWYRAEVLLTPADAKGTQGLLDQLGGLGGLAGIAGINVGETDTVEPLAVLTSREFTRAFIIDNNLLPVLFADDWDARAGRWKASDPQDQPDIYDAVKYFDKDIRSVKQDMKTTLVTVSIEWTDPKLAAAWANALVERLNERMRRRSLQETDAKVAYLKRELAETNVITLQQSVGRLLEGELQKAMVARVNEEFAFRIVDRAEVPKWRSRPKRVLVVGFALIVGLLLPGLMVLARDAIRRNRRDGDKRLEAQRA